MMGAMTWNRQISRILYANCVSCHREDGAAFSLVEYGEARAAAEAIKHAVLERSMPPWGAVKGFGQFQNEQALAESEIEMIVDWVETGAARGNNPRALPERPDAPAPAPRFVPSRRAVAVSGPTTLSRQIEVAGLFARDVAPEQSLRIVAELPDGTLEPLVWLDGYRDEYAHPFWLLETLSLPAGTRIRGLPETATLLLLPRRGR